MMCEQMQDIAMYALSSFPQYNAVVSCAGLVISLTCLLTEDNIELAEDLLCNDEVACHKQQRPEGELMAAVGCPGWLAAGLSTPFKLLTNVHNHVRHARELCGDRIACIDACSSCRSSLLQAPSTPSAASCPEWLSHTSAATTSSSSNSQMPLSQKAAASALREPWCGSELQWQLVRLVAVLLGWCACKKAGVT